MDSDAYVLTIGAAAVDIKGMPHEPLVDLASNPGMVLHSFGGVARNIAENLARLEVNSIFLTAVGEDPAGDSIVQHCESSGIDMQYVKFCPDARSGFYISILDHLGDLALGISDFEIMNFLDSAYLESKRELFAAARMVVIDLNLSETALQTVFELANMYRVPVIADPTSPVRAKKLYPYLNQLYLVVPNAAETTTLCGLEIPAHDLDSAVKAADHLLEMGTRIAIITLGERGLAYAEPGNKGHIPAQQAHIVDSTGAGDALTAGVIFGLVNDVPLDEAMRLGVTAATLTLQSQASVYPHLNPDLLYNSLVV